MMAPIGQFIGTSRAAVPPIAVRHWLQRHVHVNQTMASSRSQHRANSMSTPLRWVNIGLAFYLAFPCLPLYAISPVVGVVGLVVALVGIIVLIIRTVRSGVTLMDESLVNREVLRTRTIPYRDISAVEELPYQALNTWGAMSNGHILQVILTDGKWYRLRGTAGGGDLLPVSRTTRRAEFKAELEARVQATANAT